MKIILLENLRKIGAIGDVINVKRGFARNYLIAKKKALYASKETKRTVSFNQKSKKFGVNLNENNLIRKLKKNWINWRYN